MKAYQTCWNQITEVDAEKFTDTSIWINGRRSNVKSGWKNYFPSWEMAKAFIIANLESELARAKRMVDVARSNLETAKALKRGTKGDKACLNSSGSARMK